MNALRSCYTQLPLKVQVRTFTPLHLVHTTCASQSRHRAVRPRIRHATSASASDEINMGIPDLKLLELRAKLDRQIVGHDELKECLLLGLLAKEHIYIEGPPGVGKTQLAEAAASEAGLSSFFYQFHRDTRVHELVGDTTILREQTSKGEIIRQGVQPGGILTAHVCVLDDISRAPGEALNVLLRMLNERNFVGVPMLLRCAIATGNPPQEEFFNESLDPAILDRFALQLCVSGYVKLADWTSCRNIVNQHCLQAASASMKKRIIEDDMVEHWSSYYKKVSQVEFPDDVLTCLLEILDVLVNKHGLGTAHPALLTDRTFLVKAPRLMQANAVLNGRCKCVYDDLYILRFLTRFRIPESVHRQINDIIKSVIELQGQTPEDSDHHSGESGEMSEQSRKKQESLAAESKSQQQSSREASSDVAALRLYYHISSLKKYLKWFWDDLRGAERPIINDLNVRIEGVEGLIRALHGSIQRSNADSWQRVGGLPRQWRAMRSINEVPDSDAGEFSLWCSNPSPMLPRTSLRHRVERGGALAVIRDISDSMSRPRQEYLLARCASLAICTIIDLARRHHMRVGYNEFADDSRKHFANECQTSFFTRDYIGIQDLARNLQTCGGTCYQRVLQDVLSEFERLSQIGGSGQRMHAVMLSDGEPTIGCTKLHDERKWAQRLRVCIHTVFIGSGSYPPVLARLAVDTGGKRFQAIPHYDADDISMVDVSHEPVPNLPFWKSWVS